MSVGPTNANSVRFGPGTFLLGETPGVAYECQVQSMGINVTKNTGDDISVLCGDTILGTSTYAYALAGTVLQDFGAAAGLIEFSWVHKGETVPFTFVPSTAAATSVTGEIVMDPLPFSDSGAAYGDVLTADFEWSMQGEPTFTWPTGGAARGARKSEPVAASS